MDNPDPDTLAQREVAITGRLLSMSRPEAMRQLLAAGARYVAQPGERTDLLVLGQGGPPLGEDGQPTESLRRAQQLIAAGRGPTLLREEQFLARLGLHERVGDLQRLYTGQQLSRILQVPAGQVRTWVRHGLIRPARVVKRLQLFEYREVATARDLVQLTLHGISLQRLRKSLDQLAGWLGEGERPLAQLQALEHGGHLVVRLSDGRLADPSGQLHLGFSGGALPDTAAAGAPPDTSAAGGLPAASSSPAASTAGSANASDVGATASHIGATAASIGTTASDVDACFARGLAAEERGQHDAAVDAYRQALRIQPREECAFNLGNCLFALGRATEAIAAYEQAVGLDPEYVEAWNNLGIASAEAGQLPVALAALRRALLLAPDYADAHYNLAETLAAAGDIESARPHWHAYLAQDPHSEWAHELRERLQAL